MARNGLGGAGENCTNWTLTEASDRMERFLDKLRNSGNIRLSCRAASVPRSTVYYWRRKFKTFEAEWDEALEDACDILEAEAWRRAVEEQSDRLLMFLLKAHRPDKFKDRWAGEVTGADGGPIELRWPEAVE